MDESRWYFKNYLVFITSLFEKKSTLFTENPQLSKVYNLFQMQNWNSADIKLYLRKNTSNQKFFFQNNKIFFSKIMHG